MRFYCKKHQKQCKKIKKGVDKARTECYNFTVKNRSFREFKLIFENRRTRGGRVMYNILTDSQTCLYPATDSHTVLKAIVVG